MRHGFRHFLSALLVVVLTGPANAQGLKLKDLNLGESLGIASRGETTATATLRSTPTADVVRLDILIKLAPGSNTYSQNPEFSKPTRFFLDATELTPVEPAFQPDHPPKAGFDQVLQQNVEKFVDQVTFSRTFRVPPGVDANTLKLSGVVDLLVCDSATCAPNKLPFEAAYDESVKAEPLTETFVTPPQPDPAPPKERASTSSFATGYVITPTRGRDGKAQPDPATLQFELSTAQAVAGETVTLAVTLTPNEKWQTYGIVAAMDQLETPTSFKWPELVNLEASGEMRSVPEPELHKTDAGASLAHPARVTWLQDFKALTDGPVGLKGIITYQLCEDGVRCLAPNRATFDLGTAQTPDLISTASALVASYLPNADAAHPVYALEEEKRIESLAVALPLAFLGGLILNIMPCVLPVLAIKILSFVQQAGEHRSRILALNLAYTVGVLTVFLGLAALAVVLNLGWGQQFQNTQFLVVMIAVVFAMALSLLGVFELPIPGIIPSANSHQEGLPGAFMTGIVATLLATPCSGPFMVPVFTWTLSQPPTVIFLIFGVMGLGMASPYVAAGMFPALVNWLPKPGMWMVRFKQFSGFVLLGTVLFLMYSLDQRLVMPVLLSLLGLSLLLWMIGNLYNEVSPLATKWRVRVSALVLSAPLLFFGLMPVVEPLLPKQEVQSEIAAELPWEPFSEQRMMELREQGVPTLIDFTADWCGICKQNELFALNTRSTAEFVKKHGVVTLVADYTSESPEIRKWLNKFGQDTVPLTIIFPKGTDRKLIALRGAYFKPGLLKQLERAVSGDNGAPEPPADQSVTSNP